MAKKLHSDPSTRHFTEVLKMQTVNLWCKCGYNFSSCENTPHSPPCSPFAVVQKLDVTCGVAETLKVRHMGLVGTVLGFSFCWETCFGTYESSLVSKHPWSQGRC